MNDLYLWLAGVCFAAAFGLGAWAIWQTVKVVVDWEGAYAAGEHLDDGSGRWEKWVEQIVDAAVKRR